MKSQNTFSAVFNLTWSCWLYPWIHLKAWKINSNQLIGNERIFFAVKIDFDWFWIELSQTQCWLIGRRTQFKIRFRFESLFGVDCFQSLNVDGCNIDFKSYTVVIWYRWLRLWRIGDIRFENGTDGRWFDWKWNCFFDVVNIDAWRIEVW